MNEEQSDKIIDILQSIDNTFKKLNIVNDLEIKEKRLDLREKLLLDRESKFMIRVEELKSNRFFGLLNEEQKKVFMEILRGK